MNGLELRQLRILATVAEVRSFSEASRLLMMSQPSVSRAVSEIERLLRVRLFERTTRSVALTAAGREMVATAAEILRAAESGFGRFDAYRSGLAGLVTVAALPSLAAGLLPSVVASFLRDRPDCRITIREGLQDEIAAWALDGTADIAVGAGPAGLSGLPVAGTTTRLGGRYQEAFTVWPLMKDRLIALLPGSAAPPGQSTITWKELARLDKLHFLRLPESSSLRTLTDAGFAEAGVQPARVVDVASLTSAAGLVRAGLGALVISAAARHMLAFADAVTLDLRSPTLGRSLTVVTRANPALAPPAAALLDAILTAARRRRRPSGSRELEAGPAPR